MSVWNTIMEENTPSHTTSAARASMPPSQNNAALQTTQTPSQEHDIATVLKLLWVRKILIIFVMAACIGLGFLYLSYKAPQFTSQTVLHINSEGSGVPGLGNLRALGGGFNNNQINAELEILRSPEMALRVIEALALDTDNEFRPNPENYISLTDQQAEQIMIERFIDHITIRPVSGSSIIRLEARSTVPEKAAMIANKMAEIYLKDRFESKLAENKRMLVWMEDKKNELELQTNKDLQAVKQFQSDNNILGDTALTLHNQELIQLKAQLAEAQKLEDIAAQKVAQIRQQSGRGGVNTLQEVLSSPTIISLKGRETAQKAELASLSERYGDKHPLILSARANLEKIQTQIIREIRLVAQSIEAQAETAQNQRIKLEEKIADVQKNFSQQTQKKLIQLQELRMRAEASKTLYEAFILQYQQALPLQHVIKNDAKILSYAAVPVRSSYPNRNLVIGLTFMIGLFLGVFLALVLDQSDERMRALDDLERFTGFPLYGVIPQGNSIKTSDITKVLHDKPASTLAEALRTLRINVALRCHEHEDVSVITVTSSRPGEGKSTTASWLAHVAAKGGERAIIIDCDLRRPKLHQYFGVNNNSTLVEYLTDRAEIKDIISKDPRTDLDIITCRSTPTNALSLLTSTKMDLLIEALRQDYDLIILDAPSASALADPFILSKMSDRTLYVVDWPNVQKNELDHTMKKFRAIYETDIGLIANKVDLKKAGLKKFASLSYAYSSDDLAHIS